MKTGVALFALVLAGAFSLGAAATGAIAASTWTGAVSSDWNTAGNWSPAVVPTASSDVTIPTGLSVYPVVTGDVSMKQLTIQSGATLGTSGTPVITCSEDVEIKVGGTLNLGLASMSCGHDLRIKGTFNAGGGTLTVDHHFDNTGVFNADSSTVVMTGGGDIMGGPTTFYNLTILGDTQGHEDITVTNDLIVATGATLSMGGNTLTVKGSISGGGSITATVPFISALTVVSATELDVDFSENVDLATSQTLGNYAVDNGISVSSATRNVSDNSIVRLVVSSLTPGLENTLTVNNVEDAGGTPIAANSEKHFTLPGSPSFDITATAGSGGSISPSGVVSVSSGSDQGFSMSPNAGHHIDSVVVDGVNQGAVTSFDFTNVTAGHSIAAWFSFDVYTINASASAGGSISPSGAVSVNFGSDQSFSMVPDPGYFITDVFVDSVNVGNPSSYGFTNVTANHLLEAVFSTNARPTPVLLLSPVHQDTVYSDQFGAVAFRWSSSTDENPGDNLTYTLTITGPSVNYSTGPLTDTSVTLDLSTVVGLDQSYDWTVSVSDGILTTNGGTFAFFVTSLTGVDEVDGLQPRSYALEQNYPNPFNPSTTIRFDLPERSEVVLTLFNVLGVQVMEIYGGKELGAGTYRETVNFSALSTGVYFYRLEARGVNGASFTQIRKMVLMK